MRMHFQAYVIYCANCTTGFNTREKIKFHAAPGLNGACGRSCSFPAYTYPHMLNGFIPNRACLAFFSQICIENNEAECLFVLHVRRSDLYSSQGPTFILCWGTSRARSRIRQKKRTLAPVSDTCRAITKFYLHSLILYGLIIVRALSLSLSPPSRPFSCLRRLCANALAALPEKIACARGEKKRPLSYHSKPCAALGLV